MLGNFAFEGLDRFRERRQRESVTVRQFLNAPRQTLRDSRCFTTDARLQASHPFVVYD
jgi:hypothetical protein